MTSLKLSRKYTDHIVDELMPCLGTIAYCS